MTKMIFQFLDVGQGDGTLVIMGSGEKQELALIDFGECRTQFKDPRDDAMKYLVDTIARISKERGLIAPYLDHLFITHPHKDHVNLIPHLLLKSFPKYGKEKLIINKLTYGGAKALYDYRRRNFIDDISHYVSGTVEELADSQCSEVNAKTKTVKPKWKFVDKKILVYLLSSNFPIAATKKDYNTLSLCLMFDDQAGNKVILMGDAGMDVEKKIRSNFNGVPNFLKAYALKLGHHGSKGSTSEEWLKEVSPTAVFASGDMVWHHPYCEAINRVIKVGTLGKGNKTHWYCCGDSAEKDYMNRNTDLLIFLNLWYRVRAFKEKMTDTKTGKTAFQDYGYTCGVQWELEFDGIKDVSIAPTDTFVPTNPPK